MAGAVLGSRVNICNNMVWLTKHAFGLDISDASIEACEVSNRFGKLTVTAYGRRELEPGVVVNGQILNKPKLSDAIAELVQAGRFSTKNVILSIPESKTFIHVFPLPMAVGQENLADAVQYKADESIPLSFDQVYHDYQVLTQTENERDILYVAAFRDVIDDFWHVLLQANLQPLVFETESLSLARALTHGEQFEGVLIVDCGARTTIITIYDHYGIRYSHNVPLGGNTFTEAIAASLKVSTDKAEQVKREIGLASPAGQPKGSLALEPIMKKIVQSIKQSIAYYQQRSGFVINSVVCCGGTSLMPGFIQYLQQQLQLKVDLGNPLQGLRYPKNAFRNAPPVLFSTAVGLALRGVDSRSIGTGINVLINEKQGHVEPKAMPKPQRQKKQAMIATPQPGQTVSRKRTVVLVGIFCLLIVAFAVIFLLQRNRPDPLISIVKTNLNATGGNNNTATGAIPLQVPVTLYTNETQAVPSDGQRGTIVEVAVQQTKEFTATGTGTAQAITSGSITIVNNYSADQSLVATTRFLTPDGALFRLRKTITVPARGSVEAEIYADNPGSLGTVKPAKMTIPGLSTSMQQYIYGESTITFGPRSEGAKVVAEADLTAARGELRKLVQETTVEALKFHPQAGTELVPHILEVTGITDSFSKKVGEATDTFTGTAQGKARVVVVSTDVMTKILRDFLEQKISSTSSLEGYQFTPRTYHYIDYQATTGTMKIEVSSTATLFSSQ